MILDVDGTIAEADNVVSPRTRAVMRDIEEKGVPVVVATGRTRSSLLDILGQTGLRTPGVSCNGAIVTDPASGRDLLGFGAPSVTPARPPARMPDEIVKTMCFGTPEEMDAATPTTRRGAAAFLEEVLRQVAP